MIRSIRTIRDVVDWGLCTGCGVCASACPAAALQMRCFENEGNRPVAASAHCADCGLCLQVCPGYHVNAPEIRPESGKDITRHPDIGPVLEIWEGYAADEEIRFSGSSGGILTALALHCLRNEGIESVLHTGAEPDHPCETMPIISRSREELLAATGSRYISSSPGVLLRQFDRPGPKALFIGKPCDVAGCRLLCAALPAINERIALTMSFFCAGTPSSKGTLDLLEQLELNPSQIKSIRYRGHGWPGMFTITERNGSRAECISYEEAWAHLTHYRPFRCNLCPDGVGWSADISCGDAWHRLTARPDLGQSVVLVRTPKGREILHRAIEQGDVILQRIGSDKVIAGQQSLLQRRRIIFGRLLAMRDLAVPTPKIKGFGLIRAWIRQPLSAKIRSVVGTSRRILRRRLWKRSNRFQVLDEGQSHEASESSSKKTGNG